MSWRQKYIQQLKYWLVLIYVSPLRKEAGFKKQINYHLKERHLKFDLHLVLKIKSEATKCNKDSSLRWKVTVIYVREILTIFASCS